MIKALLDANILVDVLRKYQPAENWLLKQRDLAITRVVWLEIIEGAENQVEQKRAIVLLNDFELTELTISDLDWATHQLIRYRLTPLLGKLAQQPY